MPAYSNIINIVGGATSNSYVSGTEADEYAEFQSWNDTWAAKSESERRNERGHDPEEEGRGALLRLQLGSG